MSGEVHFISDAEFRQNLSVEFTIVEIQGNGNCFFSALAERLEGSFLNQQVCRTKIWKYISEHYNEISEFVDLDDEEMRDELAAILKPTPGRWGGHLAIYGACNAYVCNIHHHQPNARTRIHTFQNQPPAIHPRDVYISYHDQNHYNLLIPHGEDDEMDVDHDVISEDAANPKYNEEMEVDHEGHPEENHKPNNDDSLSDPENDDDDPSYNGDSDSQSSGDAENPNDDSSLTDGANDSDDPSYDGDSSEDHSDSECQSSDDAENPILDDPGFPFTAHGLYKKSRDELTVAILIQIKDLKHRTLLEALKAEKPKEVYLLTLYNRNDLSMLCSDSDIASIFAVYTQDFSLPDERVMHDRGVWLSNTLVLPILLSVIGYSWGDLKIKIMCKMSRKSKPAELLNKIWPKVRASLLEDLAYLITNPRALFCEKCEETCVLRQKRWHSDLSKYRLKLLSDENRDFVRSFSTFDDPNFDLVSPIMDRLGDVERSSATMQEKLEDLKVVLDQNAEMRNTEYFSTYLILLMDGTDISKYSRDDVINMLKDPGIKKTVYAGQTTNAPFRDTHFTDPNSSVNKALTTTSRLYFIRKKRFSIITEAELDEAILIEILKGSVKDSLEKSVDQPFLLLNVKSESRKILPVNRKEKQQITLFRTSGIPIFRTDPTNLQQSNYRRFRGNYEIKEPVPMQPGAYQFKNFSDDIIQDYYHEIDGRLPH